VGKGKSERIEVRISCVRVVNVGLACESFDDWDAGDDGGAVELPEEDKIVSELDSVWVREHQRAPTSGLAGPSVSVVSGSAVSRSVKL